MGTEQRVTKKMLQCFMDLYLLHGSVGVPETTVGTAGRLEKDNTELDQ